MENRYRINYDIKTNNISNINFKQGDTGSSVIEIHLKDNGLAINITDEIMEFRFLKADKTIVFQTLGSGVTIIDALNGKVECVLMTNTLAFPGDVKCEIHRQKGGLSLTTPSFSFKVVECIGEGVLSTNYIGSIELFLIDMTASENIRKTNEDDRIALYEDIQNKLNTGQLKGEQGIPGQDGIGTGDMLKSIYDPDGDGKIDYNDLSNKPTIAVTKEDVGLGNVDNTSDADKPVSTAQQIALDTKADQSSLSSMVTQEAFTDEVVEIITNFSPLLREELDRIELSLIYNARKNLNIERNSSMGGII